MILVTFAVPFESAAFRRRPIGREGRGVRILHTGVGLDAARVAFAAALSRERLPARVISAGFAGALISELAVGDRVDGTTRLVSAPEVLATTAAKREFRVRTGAEAVDMETDALRDVCAAAGVPFTVCRVISDTAEDDLGLPPELLTALSRRPVRAFPRLAAILLTNARRRAAFLRLVKDCWIAQAALADALERELGPVSRAAA